MARRDGGVLDALDADAVRRWCRLGLVALEAARAEINSLNVFPVADADTGTNLYLTLQSAVEAEDDESANSSDLAETATAVAQLCLLGARGSSGVILSQLLRGVAEVLAAERRPPRGLALTSAFERAVELAYAAVSQPVEGTMLTVSRVAAEAARATGSDDLGVVVGAAQLAAYEALALTPSQLDVLSRAGVVDAGGRGIVVLLDVLKAVVDERELALPESRVAEPMLDGSDLAVPMPPAYEVMYLIDADDDRIAGLRAALDEIGNAVVVSGGDGLWNVHVHTDDAAAAINIGAVAGRPHSVRITEMADQRARAADPLKPAEAHAEDLAPAAALGPAGAVPTGRLVVVVLDVGSAGLALRTLLTNAGAHVVEAVNPAAIADDLAGLRVPEVVVLVEAAGTLGDHVRLAVGSSTADITLILVEAPVQLLSAVAVHDPHRPLPDDAAAMAVAVANTRHATVGPAADDQLVVRALGAIERLLGEDGELVTVVSVAEVGSMIADRLANARPEIDVNQLTVDMLGSVVWLGVE
jgi:DAK2 domain fusion protein YloV